MIVFQINLLQSQKNDILNFYSEGEFKENTLSQNKYWLIQPELNKKPVMKIDHN